MDPPQNINENTAEIISTQPVDQTAPTGTDEAEAKAKAEAEEIARQQAAAAEAQAKAEAEAKAKVILYFVVLKVHTLSIGFA